MGNPPPIFPGTIRICRKMNSCSSVYENGCLEQPEMLFQHIDFDSGTEKQHFFFLLTLIGSEPGLHFPYVFEMLIIFIVIIYGHYIFITILMKCKALFSHIQQKKCCFLKKWDKNQSSLKLHSITSSLVTTKSQSFPMVERIFYGIFEYLM